MRHKTRLYHYKKLSNNELFKTKHKAHALEWMNKLCKTHSYICCCCIVQVWELFNTVILNFALEHHDLSITSKTIEVNNRIKNEKNQDLADQS